MRRFLQNPKTLTVLISILILIGFTVAYLNILSPKFQEKEFVINQIQNLKNETQAIEKEIEELEHPADESDEVEQEKLPSERQIDEVLRTLKNIETVTNTHIKTIDFTQYDLLVKESGMQLDDETEYYLSELNTRLDNLLDQLKLVSFRMEVEVKDYQHLLKFLTSIEKEKRFIRIENVSFMQSQQTDPEEPVAPILLQLQLTTYYFKDEAN